MSPGGKKMNIFVAFMQIGVKRICKTRNSQNREPVTFEATQMTSFPLLHLMKLGSQE